MTGDNNVNEISSLKAVASSHLIITTSEKWDAVTRRWKEHIYLLGNVALLMVDEVHMLGDKDRGATLESIICRMKTVRKAATEKVRRAEKDAAIALCSVPSLTHTPCRP